MLLEQFDLEMSIPYPIPGGFYYWTHSYIYDLDNPPVGITSLAAIQILTRRGLLTSVRQTRFQKTQPPYSGTPYFKSFVPGVVMGLYTFTGGWSLFDSVRLTYYHQGQYVGYKRWRMPIPANQIVDGNLSATLYAHFRDTIAPQLIAAKICSRTGLPIDRIDVSPRVHQWQWRHGSKRRSRHVIDTP